ncbi:MAG: DNA polymerase IV [Leptospiraceae bacterium]|nr:DNA polymerase IV [Leptospiraceae bacterium]
MPMKKIIHVDMDAFYASVEIRENPSLLGKPVVVGGSPNSRGVVCAASYEARKYGVRSAIPCSLAKRLCPEAIFVYPNFPLYSSISQEIRAIFHSVTDLVEPLSLDEAYLDVTCNHFQESIATKLAEQIQRTIFQETNLTASCGVSYNKFLAKIASDWRKPNGIFVIRPKDAPKFLLELPIGKFYGVGKVTETKMKSLGIHKGKDLYLWNRDDLVFHFGKVGAFYYDIVRGVDNRNVNPTRERKSLGIEDTFSQDSKDANFLETKIESLVDGLEQRRLKRDIRGRSLTVKIKYSNFTVKSMTRTYTSWLEQKEEITSIAKDLFFQVWDHATSLRLLGIALGNLDRDNQDEDSPSLFDQMEV